MCDRSPPFVNQALWLRCLSTRFCNCLCAYLAEKSQQCLVGASICGAITHVLTHRKHTTKPRVHDKTIKHNAAGHWRPSRGSALLSICVFGPATFSGSAVRPFARCPKRSRTSLSARIVQTTIDGVDRWCLSCPKLATVNCVRPSAKYRPSQTNNAKNQTPERCIRSPLWTQRFRVEMSNADGPDPEWPSNRNRPILDECLGAVDALHFVLR